MNDLAGMKEKGELLIKAVAIVQKLSKNDIADRDDENDSISVNDIKNLIIDARSLVQSPWWNNFK